MTSGTPLIRRTGLPDAQQSAEGAVVTRQTWGFVNWTLRPNREPDAPLTRYKFRCVTEDENGEPCGAESDECENFAAARDWTYDHMRDHPDHVSYAEVVVRPWAMWRYGPAW